MTSRAMGSMSTSRVESSVGRLGIRDIIASQSAGGQINQSLVDGEGLQVRCVGGGSSGGEDDGGSGGRDWGAADNAEEGGEWGRRGDGGGGGRGGQELSPQGGGVVEGGWWRRWMVSKRSRLKDD